MPKTEDEYYASIQTNLQQNTPITNFSQSSRANIIAAAVAAELGDLTNEVEYFKRNSKPTTATGENLDAHGELYGLERLVDTAASTQGMGPTIKFTNSSAQTQTIVAGTRIWSSRDRSVMYRIVGSVTIPAGDEAFADAVAVNTGSEYNVGIGAIDSHNGPTSVTVTNISSIIGGESEESDENFTYRISAAPLMFAGGNETAIRQAAIQVSGVKDVYIRNLARGCGTIDVLLYSIDPHVSDTLIENVSEAISDVVPPGIDARVIKPVEKQVRLTIKLKTDGSENISTVSDRVKSAIHLYIDNLPIGDGSGAGTIYYSELIQRVMDTSTSILDFDAAISIDSVEQLLTNLIPAQGERFVCESVKVS